MIRYLSYIYDMRANNGVNCTATTLQVVFKVRPNDLAKELAPAFKKRYISCCGMYLKLTKDGEKYVENYRHGQADDGFNEKQPEN